MKIQLLSENLINQIAAGEVIEKPASVVKELVENAIDAGATKVSLAIRHAGKSFIAMQDNGEGMSKEELEMALLRHATSKLQLGQLDKIKTCGFRGEALPSIASISRLSITSKAKNQQQGWQIILEGGKQISSKPANCQQGTLVEVRDIFYATPARLKFLRSDRYENLHIFDIYASLILANPSIAFQFHDGTRERFHLPAIEKSLFSEEFDDDFFGRMKNLFGKTVQNNYISVKAEFENNKIHGYIGLPTYTSGRNDKQFFFINQRVVKDKLLTGVLRAAFSDFIPSRRYPVCMLFLTVPHQEIDVNVHPAKTEVRFQDPQKIRHFIFTNIKKHLQTNGQFVAEENQTHLNTYFQKETTFSTTTQPQQLQLNEKVRNLLPPSARPFQQENHDIQNQINNPISEQLQSYPMGAAVAQLHKNYIIAQNETGFIIIDQHAAHERIVYEKMKENLTNKAIESQRLLVPEIITFTKEERDLLLEHQKNLNECGLEINEFGINDIIVTAIPAMLKNPNFDTLFEHLLTEFKNHSNNNPLMHLLERICATMACYGSIRSGRLMSVDDMNALLRLMEKTPHSGQCNHGRPTFIKMSLTDLEKLFERR